MSTRHPRAVTRQSAARTVRWKASFVVALLLLAQVSFLVQLAVYPHVLSPATGKVAHPSCGSPCQSDRSNQHPARPANKSHDDECQVFTVLTQASVVPVFSSVVVAAAPVCERAGIAELEEPRPHQWDLYRLSPSHSPPSLA